MRKPIMVFWTRLDTNQAAQAQEIKFCIYKVEELYFQCGENKGADQLCSYCEADLHLWFGICRLLVFS